MQLICGVHGSGKTSFCQNLSKKLGLRYFSASELIDRRITLNQYNTKKIDRIDDRQNVLVQEVAQLHKRYTDFLLDGHLCLVNQQNEIVRISKEIFKLLGITKIWLVQATPNDIFDRLKKRDCFEWTNEYITNFQNEERSSAYELANFLNIEIEVVDTSKKINIILPIAPSYAEKILLGEKKYEYRKKLCARTIHKIYLYATSPIKAIVGEVNVLSKISLETNDLWDVSSELSGVEHSFYMNYFDGHDFAYAYVLGDAYRYSQSIKLKDVGIDFAPQSFIYVAEI